MAAAAGTAGILTFSTDDLPARDRIPMWREVFARAVVKVDLEPLGEQAFRSESQVYRLPDLMIRRSRASPALVTRTPPLVADGDDNLVLTILRQGRMVAAQGPREVAIEPGGAYLWSNAATGFARNPVAMDLLTLALPRRGLKAAVKDLDRALMRPLPATSEPLRLLVGYIDLLQGPQGPLAPELLALTAAHIQDLAALALGATRDAAETAHGGGLRAARLQAVKADVLANLANPELTVGTVALRQGISPRYIRALFDGEGTTFTDFVREHRLRRAFRMLGAPALAGQKISTIAFDCGFGDLSHFNAVFRRRFGATPSDIRAQAELRIRRGHGDTAAGP